MKTAVHVRTLNFHAIFVIGFVCLSFITTAQSIPELIFQNAALINGTAGNDGAQYRFSNVGSGLDAILEIKGRSASNVVVNNIDLTSTGWNKALQPEVGIVGTVGPNQSWWVKFRLTFYEAGTNSKKKITKFAVTSLDIDGNGGSLREWVEMDKVTSLSFSSITSLADNLLAKVIDLLDLNNNGEDHKIIGDNNDYPGIDTSATNLMATYNYDNKDQIDFYLGAKTGSSSNSSAMRMSSLWFKQFNLNKPISLPVKLLDFTAKYTKPNVLLEWSTSQEHDFSHFILEHSTDGTNFDQTALVFGAGESNSRIDYSYTDKNMNDRGGIIYYRLKQVDVDGKFDYSRVRIVKLGEEDKSISVTTFPNPVVKDLRITLPSSWQNKRVYVDLYNANGQLINTLQIANSSQTESISVSTLRKGTYFLYARCGNETARQQIIKN